MSEIKPASQHINDALISLQKSAIQLVQESGIRFKKDDESKHVTELVRGEMEKLSSSINPAKKDSYRIFFKIIDAIAQQNKKPES